MSKILSQCQNITVRRLRYGTAMSLCQNIVNNIKNFAIMSKYLHNVTMSKILQYGGYDMVRQCHNDKNIVNNVKNIVTMSKIVKSDSDIHQGQALGSILTFQVLSQEPAYCHQTSDIDR